MQHIYLLVFNNTHEAITAEAKLKELSIENRVMPTPTDITKSCGISLRIREEDIEAIKALVGNEKLKIKNIYYKEENKYNSILP